jgi:hypothetical protein
MPIDRFRDLDEAARSLPPSPDSATGVATSLFLARLDLAAARGVRTTPAGVHRYRSFVEGKLDKERRALARLRESDRPAAR